MDCNKEEAIRAKEIAEKKMQQKDFVGARKVALKAQQLCPEVENISQMLTVCDVHCSAENKMFGAEMDWYGILQIDQTADEASIKKQYRKLALLLHPDKNNFSGAESAFKLIGEAQRVLSDQAKRSLYDMKRRASLRTALPKPQANRNSYVRKQPGVQNNFVNIATPQSMGLNSRQQQQAQQGFPNIRQTFWTICPFCGIRYQYYRDIVNRSLRCQSCSKPFIAYDSNVQGAPPEANWSQPAFPNPGAYKVGPQSNIGNISSSMGVQGSSSSGTKASEPFPMTGRTSGVGRGSKTKGKEDGNVDMEIGKEARKSGKRRKSVVESSDSCHSESSTDIEEDDVIEEGSGLPAGSNSGFTGGRYPRRSARQKQNISYKENLSDDDDFVSPPKRSRGSGSSSSTEDSKEASLEQQAFETDKPAGFADIVEEDMKEVKQKATAPLEESSLNRNGKAKECKANGEEAASVDDNEERSKVDEESESHSNPNGTPNREYEYPDPDFSDFDEERREECFAVDQIWAAYDSADGMPRFYARIRKVFAPGFKLRITWLEPDPDDQDEIDWVSVDLPVGCGKFKHGASENTADRNMFSHKLYWENGRSRSSYKIYPRKGEIWALFKKWDIKWNSDPDNHRQYEYEFVEVLSDYVEGGDISVTYLGKVKGFVSLFSRTMKKGVVSFQIPASEQFRFSHRIPSFRMTGMERDDVPKGSFELDPASLPANIEEFAHLGDVKMNSASRDTRVNGSCPKSSADEVKHMLRSEKLKSPKKTIDLEEENMLERKNPQSRNQSPRDLNGSHKKPGQANASPFAAKEETHLDGIKEADKERRLDAEDTKPNSVTKDPNFPQASSPEEIPEAEFYDFDDEKSQEKFQRGQTWALYSDVDGMPKYYACIKKIEPPPKFKLHVTWLEPSSSAKNIIQWLDKDMPVPCGTFKAKNVISETFNDTSPFSHQLRAEPTDKKNRYDIYPRKGEVWALYKNWNSEWACSDLKNREFDIVEVDEDNELGTKVLVLVRVNGFKLVFKAQRRGKSAVMEVPRAELLRFSHRIPAFRLTEERDGSLRGCWELDPASIPASLFRSK